MKIYHQYNMRILMQLLHNACILYVRAYFQFQQMLILKRRQLGVPVIAATRWFIAQFSPHCHATLCKPCENSWTQHMRRHAYIHMYIWTFEYLISSEVTVKVCILPHCLLDRTAVRLHNSIHFNLQLLEAIREGLVSNLAATLLLFLFIFF